MKLLNVFAYAGCIAVGGCGLDSVPASDTDTDGGTHGGTHGTTDSGTDDSADGSSGSTGEPLPEYMPRPTQIVFDPAGGWWDLPIPSDLRVEEDGTWDLDKWPEVNSALINMWLAATDTRLVGGWGVGMGVLVRASGAIDDASLPGDGAPSTELGASMYLLDVDPDSPERGRRLPIRPRYRSEAPRFGAANTIMAMPVFGFTRRSSTQYALVVTEGLLDVSGEPVGRSRPFHDAWVGAPDAEPATIENLAPLRATLEAEGINPATIVGAAVFTTIDTTGDLLHLAEWAETLPDPVLSEAWTVAEEYDNYQVLTSRYSVPVFQSGQRPYAEMGEGLIVYGEDGNPVIGDTQLVRLALTVPKTAQPADGFPLMMYLHGSGGNWYQAIDRGPVPETKGASGGDAEPGTGPAELLARRGVATLAFDFPLHGDRNDPPDETGLSFYNIFGNIEATLDNFNVAVVELLLLSRLANTMDVDASLADSLDAGAAADGTIRFDPERLTAMGQSMGTTLGVRWAAVDPRVKGVVWSGAGGVLIEIATKAVEPLDVRMLLVNLTGIPDEELDDTHPLLHAFQNVWDLADPIVTARHSVREPFDNVPLKDIMMTAGITDGYFAPSSQAAMAIGLGTPIAGESVEETLPEVLELSGAGGVDYPVQAKVGGKTVAVVQYAAPHTLGHYVVFNQEGARHQYACFVATVGTEGGAVIPEAGTIDAACE
ncbi:MAG: hypothetical protein JKY37_16380 [Nannocystaceae bacterium]|nr:hypothetical protein [Nannocystaceae bacterium]